MSDKTNVTQSPEPETEKPAVVNESRRRAAKAGLAGSGVLLTLASRSVLGDWGVCTGSELMSGNLSKPGKPNPCGCSPGYWGNTNGYNTWMSQLGKLIDNQYAPTAMFNVVFGRAMFSPDVSLKTAVNKAGTVLNTVCGSTGFKETVAFHAVAALLNAAVYGPRYPTPYQTPAAVIAAFKTAYDSGTLGSQAQCNALTAFKNAVDIYTSNNTWCFGDQHL